jgi:hypothetical protein
VSAGESWREYLACHLVISVAWAFCARPILRSSSRCSAWADIVNRTNNSGGNSVTS